MTNEEKEEFYEKCGKILNIDHEWKTPVPKRTRWNKRFLGNGRYPGFGLIRIHGQQIVITSKTGTKLFPKSEDALSYLNGLNNGKTG